MTQQLKVQPVFAHCYAGTVTQAQKHRRTVNSFKLKRRERRLTKGTNELSLHRPGDRLDEGGRREASKQHVVQEDDVEVPEPVIPTIVSQQIKAGDP